MDDLEYAIYEQSYDWLVNEIFGEKIGKQLVIYLKTDFEVCHQRLKKRGRAEEKVIYGNKNYVALRNRFHCRIQNNQKIDTNNG